MCLAGAIGVFGIGIAGAVSFAPATAVVATTKTVAAAGLKGLFGYTTTVTTTATVARASATAASTIAGLGLEAANLIYQQCGCDVPEEEQTNDVKDETSNTDCSEEEKPAIPKQI